MVSTHAMPYPPEEPEKLPEKSDGLDVSVQSDGSVKTEPVKPPEKPFRFTLFPSGQPATGKPLNWGWLWDWSDLLLLFPLALIGFLTASKWIRWLDPTAQVLSPENLTVLNWNLMMLCLASGVMFVFWKIWVGGKVFGSGWDTGLSPYERAKIRLAFLGGLAAFVAFILTRNL